jgi:hypothetical protein
MYKDLPYTRMNTQEIWRSLLADEGMN